MQDNPGVSLEEAQDFTDEYGYFRNVNPQIRWFAPNSSTKFYLPNEADGSYALHEVSYETFRDKMIPAIESEDQSYTMVKVTVSGEYIVRIETAYPI